MIIDFGDAHIVVFFLLSPAPKDLLFNLDFFYQLKICEKISFNDNVAIVSRKIWGFILLYTNIRIVHRGIMNFM